MSTAHKSTVEKTGQSEPSDGLAADVSGDVDSDPDQSGLNLDIVEQDDGWPVSVLEADFFAGITKALGRFLDLDATETAAVAFANDAAVKTLNAQYRGKDKATNVLSFPAAMPADGLPDSEAAFLGDIILARETVAREALEQGVTFEDHTTHLIVHGILHLLGYDHEDQSSAEEMEALEIDILAQLEIANPYTEELDDAR